MRLKRRFEIRRSLFAAWFLMPSLIGMFLSSVAVAQDTDTDGDPTPKNICGEDNMLWVGDGDEGEGYFNEEIKWNGISYAELGFGQHFVNRFAPKTVALVNAEGPNAGVEFCTGTLIAPDLVLTAQHCFDVTGVEPSDCKVAFHFTGDGKKSVFDDGEGNLVNYGGHNLSAWIKGRVRTEDSAERINYNKNRFEVWEEI